MKLISGLLALRAIGVACFAAVLFAALTGAAEDNKKEEHHWVTGSVSSELQNDATVDSEDPDGEINDLFATIEPEITVHFTPEVSLTALGVFEPVRDPDPGDGPVLGRSWPLPRRAPP